MTKKCNQAFEPYGLSAAHAYLIRLVLNQPGMQQKEIAQELCLEKSTITRFISKMQQQGYLLRQVFESGDLKKQAIYPTQKAKKIQVQLEQTGLEVFQQLQETIEVKQLMKFVEEMRQITEKIEQE
jgi:DNA-binding MarR family transcriptional regulator